MKEKIDNFNKENLSSGHRGITLIALVITIIVMLILVAVTINMAVNGGLFAHAGNAAKGTKEAIKEEQGLGSLADGMTTDELITKFTTDKKADLEKLKKYFIDGDETAIPGGYNSIKIIESVNIDDSHGYDIYQYNNNLYKASCVVDAGEWTCTSIEPYEVPSNQVIILGQGQEIRFTPKPNQTWYGWATDEDDTNDLDLSNLQENLTLKKLIKYVNSQDDKVIKKSPQENIPINNNMEMEKPKVMLLVHKVWGLYGGDGEAKSTDVIASGHLYCFN